MKFAATLAATLALTQAVSLQALSQEYTPTSMSENEVIGAKAAFEAFKRDDDLLDEDEGLQMAKTAGEWIEGGDVLVKDTVAAYASTDDGKATLDEFLQFLDAEVKKSDEAKSA